ncbi:MAG: NADP-dependent oxidoreductase [Acidobacteria bacterium]|nr:NADP-dependent oxidoreductase [Acidobacteriota bacterium]
MKVMRLADTQPTQLVEASLPQPQPSPGEVLVRVSAAGIIRTELQWYPTTHTKTGDKRAGAVPAHEFSGTVAAVGESVTDFTIGQAVFGMNDWFEEGALAEYCLALATSIAPAPTTLSPVEAATVPISALTAWQGLFHRGHLHPGDRVLIHGGAGGVGLFAVQIAHLYGAHVIATASPRNFDFIRQLGADEIIDSRATPFEEAITQPVEIVFDTVGGDTLLRSLPFLSPGHYAVTITSDHEAAEDPRIKEAFFIVEPNQRQLMEIAGLIDTSKLKTYVDAVVPFSDANIAYTGTPADRRGHGKLVVAVEPGVR